VQYRVVDIAHDVTNLAGRRDRHHSDNRTERKYMERWEYKTVKMEATGMLGGVVETDKLDRMLNELGAQGWNLTSVFDTNMTAGGATREVVAVLKRPIA
jgi:hypothetical protein